MASAAAGGARLRRPRHGVPITNSAPEVLEMETAGHSPIKVLNYGLITFLIAFPTMILLYELMS
ncbi:hypothetical protein [Allosphingosinicella deserti]|uniref:Uncharacterized protein n=1 Tax=Allosphingosinicella deserti TaxID=2116704 RepID=A0A2P7QNL9_9SPHN|nr:hypothetical protein [Sphingomonas deserti]PSJ39546.1 hypothetical protein C7I55_13140 [Sphingomonas deserti]